MSGAAPPVLRHAIGREGRPVRQPGDVGEGPARPEDAPDLAQRLGRLGTSWSTNDDIAASKRPSSNGRSAGERRDRPEPPRSPVEHRVGHALGRLDHLARGVDAGDMDVGQRRTRRDREIAGPDADVEQIARAGVDGRSSRSSRSVPRSAPARAPTSAHSRAAIRS